MTLKVNGVEITENAIRHELKRLIDFYSQRMLPEHLQAQMGVLAKQARNQAVGTQLLIEEVERNDIPVPKEEVDAAMANVVEQSGGDEAFDAMLADQNVSRDDVRTSITTGMQIDLLVDKLTADVPQPTDEDVKAYYEEHQQEFAKPERIMASHILVSTDSDSDDDVAAAKKKLDDIRASYEGGTSFAELAAEHSSCPTGKDSGGSLGWVARGMMVPEFEEALFSTPTGKLSDIIETSFGFHLALPSEHAEAETATLEEAADSIRELLFHDGRGRKLSEFVESLKATATIEDDEEEA